MGHVAGYAGSALVQTITGLGTIVLLTRLLPEEEYGLYALSMALLPISGSILFFWARASLARFLAEAETQNRLPGFIALLRVGFLIMAAAGLVIAGCVLLVVPTERPVGAMLWATLAATLAQGAAQLNLELHRAMLRSGRYFVLLSLVSVLGFGLAVTSAALTEFGAAGAVSAIAIASATVVLLDREAWAVWRQPGVVDRSQVRRVLVYGLPITLTMTIDSYMGNGDRLVLAWLIDLADLGAYAAAQTLASRSILVVLSAIGSAVSPLAVSALARSGPQAMRERLADGVELMLAVALPMTVGLCLLAQPITAVMIGEALSADAAALLPFIAIAALLNGLTGHYVNHAFQLAERPAVELWAIVPAAVAGGVTLVLVVPVYGVIGAAIAAMATQGTYMLLSLGIAGRILPMPVPVGRILRLVPPLAAMVGLLVLIGTPQGPLALVVTVLAGAAVYGLAALALDVCRARTLMLARLRRSP
ncbi:MAG: lipopolysaccharide biosynthesis protein [Alphaproteobacteria bacterium]|nr:lipopolysaccharide biosynthesis protein [Alphaproteobacteria bacterium]